MTDRLPHMTVDPDAPGRIIFENIPMGGILAGQHAAAIARACNAYQAILDGAGTPGGIIEFLTLRGPMGIIDAPAVRILWQPALTAIHAELKLSEAEIRSSMNLTEMLCARLADQIATHLRERVREDLMQHPNLKYTLELWGQKYKS